MEKKFVIYMHTAPNGKAYIGQTKDLERRNKVYQKTTKCRAFNNAILKYGWENFEHKILADGLTLDEANCLEAGFIEQYNTISPGGYNLRGGGKNGLHSDETKERQRSIKLGKRHRPESLIKISNASKNQSAETRDKQRLARIGKKHHPETIAKISAAMTGKERSQEVRAKISLAKQVISAETRAKLSEAAKARVPIFGRKMSEETKAKISAANKGRAPHNKGIKKGTAKAIPFTKA